MRISGGIVGGSLALALLSLVAYKALAFDPSAWVAWGREVWTLSLDTSAGPSWKPLPVLFTAPFAALADGAPWAWLTVARAGALLALAGAARFAYDACGWGGAAVAAALVAVSPWWAFEAALGNAEPLAAAAVVWAVVAHGRGRCRAALWLGVVAALIRPELLAFVVLYGVRLWRERRAPWWEPAVAVLLVVALWLVPDLLASDLRSLGGAIGWSSEGSAGRAEWPLLEVFNNLGEIAPWTVLAAAGLAARFVPQARWWLAGVLAYVLLVAVAAQAGFAGNPRYLVPVVALLAAIAGTAVAVPHGLAVGAVVVAATLALDLDELRAQRADLAQRAAIRSGLLDAIDRAGGRNALRGCGPVRSGAELRTLVAEVLREPVSEAARRPMPGQPFAVPLSGGRWRVRDCASLAHPDMRAAEYRNDPPALAQVGVASRVQAPP